MRKTEVRVIVHSSQWLQPAHVRAQSIACALLCLCSLMIAGCNTTDPSFGRTLFTTPTPRSTAMPTPSSLPANANAVDTLIPTTGCGRATPIAPGSSRDEQIAAHPAVSRGNLVRSYRLHLPTTYTADHPQAIVLAFHGHGGTAAGEESSTGFSILANQDDFIAVYPQGLHDDDNLPFWASIGPVDYGIDDALFISDVLTTLQTEFCVDPQRIYATGFSNGGGMSGFLACKLAMRIAAFAPASGNYYALPDGCHPGRPVPILEIHGSADSVVPYAGLSASENPQWPLPSIPQWLHEWAARDGCTTGPLVFLQKPDATGEQWSHCQGNSSVVHYRIEGGGHSLPSTIGGVSSEALIWAFFQAHPLMT